MLQLQLAPVATLPENAGQRTRAWTAVRRRRKWRGTFAREVDGNGQAYTAV
jgi:hypothetical protein